VRAACVIGRAVLDAGGRAVGVGVTCDEIDRVVHEATIAHDAYPSPLNYYNFPKSVCTSVNEVICHGVPDDRPLEEGDIVNIDVSVYVGGYHADLNETFFVGKQVQSAVTATKNCRHCRYHQILTHPSSQPSSRDPARRTRARSSSSAPTTACPPPSPCASRAPCTRISAQVRQPPSLPV